MNEVVLDNWVAYVRPFVNGGNVDMELVRVHLAGYVTGHPKLGDGSITTSPVKRWIGNTVETRNTRYTLKDYGGADRGQGSWLTLLTSEERARWFDDEDPIEEMM